MNYAISVLKKEIEKLENWQNKEISLFGIIEAYERLHEIERAIHILEREESLDHLRKLHDQIVRYDNY